MSRVNLFRWNGIRPGGAFEFPFCFRFESRVAVSYWYPMKPTLNLKRIHPVGIIAVVVWWIRIR